MSTLLERKGFDMKHHLWSARLLLDAANDAAIIAAHSDFLRAGADIVTTLSYQACAANLGADAPRVLRHSVALAREARVLCDRLDAQVAASCGCYGAHLNNGAEFKDASAYGDVDAAGLQAFHAAQLDVFGESDADLIAFETLPNGPELQALLALLEARAFAKPVWFSFCCRDAAHLSDGTPVRSAAAWIAAAAPRLKCAVFAVGVNCTAPQHVAALLREIAAEWSGGLIAYANSGETWSEGEWSGAAEDAYADAMLAVWREHRAQLRAVGGCCRVQPETIRALRDKIAKERGEV